MEILDIVDEAGLPTGKTVPRPEAHTLGICHRTAHIWIARRISASLPGNDASPPDSRWQVLLQKRAMTKESFPGCYDTSSAGHIQAGDEPLPSALRELEEELGLHAAPEDLTFMGNARIRYEKEFHGEMFRDNEVVFLYLYIRDVDAGSLTLQAEELDGVRWFDLEDVVRFCREHDPAFCVPSCGIAMVQKYLHSLEIIR